MRSRSAFQSLKFPQNGFRLWAVGLAFADVPPAYDTVLVDDEGGSIGDIAVKHAVIYDNALVGVVQDGEGRAPLMRRRFRAFQVIGADGENERVVLFYRGVMVCQLDELSAAERSPERAVED